MHVINICRCMSEMLQKTQDSSTLIKHMLHASRKTLEKFCNGMEKYVLCEELLIPLYFFACVTVPVSSWTLFTKVSWFLLAGNIYEITSGLYWQQWFHTVIAIRNMSSHCDPLWGQLFVVRWEVFRMQTIFLKKGSFTTSYNAWFMVITRVKC